MSAKKYAIKWREKPVASDPPSPHSCARLLGFLFCSCSREPPIRRVRTKVRESGQVAEAEYSLVAENGKTSSKLEAYEDEETVVYL